MRAHIINVTYVCADLAVVDSAVLAAARARLPRKRLCPTPSPRLARNNYLAEAGSAKPHRNAPGAGAPRGNRNAWRHGVFGRARRARRAAMRAWFAAQDRMMDAARLFRDFPSHTAARDLFEACAARADERGRRFIALQRPVDSG